MENIRNKKYLIQFSAFVLALAFVLMPVLTFAQGTTGNSGGGNSCLETFRSNKHFGGLINYMSCLIFSSVVPLIFALAVMMFLWGVVQYVINSDEEAKRAQGRQFMIWGIIALFVMVGVWGLVKILGNTFDVKTNVIPSLPTE